MFVIIRNKLIYILLPRKSNIVRYSVGLSGRSLLEKSIGNGSLLNNLCSRFISTLIPIMHWCFLLSGCHMPDDELLYGSHESLPSHFPFPLPQEYSTGLKLRSSMQTHLFFTSALQGGDCTLVFYKRKESCGDVFISNYWVFPASSLQSGGVAFERSTISGSLFLLFGFLQLPVR